MIDTLIRREETDSGKLTEWRREQCPEGPGNPEDSQCPPAARVGPEGPFPKPSGLGDNTTLLFEAIPGLVLDSFLSRRVPRNKPRTEAAALGNRYHTCGKIIPWRLKGPTGWWGRNPRPSVPTGQRSQRGGCLGSLRPSSTLARIPSSAQWEPCWGNVSYRGGFLIQSSLCSCSELWSYRADLY